MGDSFFQTIPAKVLPRYAGVLRLKRLPHIGVDDPRIPDVDIGSIGVPIDNGSRNARACDTGRNSLAIQTYRIDVESMFV